MSETLEHPAAAAAISIANPVPAEPAPARAPRREPRPPRVVVDFHAVEPHQAAIHARLENWSIWSRNRYVPASAPGFEAYRSPSVVDRYGRVLATPESRALDAGDARRVAAAVVLLPQPHRLALVWCYVKRTTPKRGCQAVGTTMEGLYRLIRDGRQMLINRCV